MKLDNYQPRDMGKLANWVRQVRAILTGALSGLSWADNIGPVATMRYRLADLPVLVPTPLAAPPSSIVLLSATDRDAGTVQSGNVVTWTWRDGPIEIAGVSDLGASTEYDLVLGILR